MKRPGSFVSYSTFAFVIGLLVPFLAIAQQIQVNGGNQVLTVTTGIAGGQPVSVTNASCSLTYQKQSVLSKITVVTSCPGQKFSLSVVATNVTKGASAPQVSLMNGNPALDLVTNIPKTGSLTGSCTLQFTASATFSQGNSSELGDDIHTITYTIQAQ